MNSVNNFTVLDSIYGKFIINRHDVHQAQHMLTTGQTHIESELNNMLGFIDKVKDGIILDIGANIGFVTVPLAYHLKDKNIRIHSYEPQKMLFNALCGTIALNDYSNVSVFNLAVGDRVGKLKSKQIEYEKNQDFGLVSWKDQEINQDGDIDCITLDEAYVDKKVSFIKIDVEGMEISVLNGAKNIIERDRPIIWLEYWMTDMTSIENYFRPLKYSIKKIDGLNLIAEPLNTYYHNSLDNYTFMPGTF